MQGMNLTSMLKSIKRRLGVTMFKLDDKDLIDILKEETLYTFSTYFPHYITVKHDLSTMKVQGKPNYYYINKAAVGNFQILSIEDMKVSDVMSAYLPYTTTYSAIDIFTDIQMAATYEDMISTPITFYYVPPDQFMIDAGPSMLTNLNVQFTVVHPDNLSTVNPSFKEQLLKLATLDIQIYLYNTLRHMDKIDTSFGQVDLKIDRWEDAEDKRSALLEEWDANYLASRRRKIFRA